MFAMDVDMNIMLGDPEADIAPGTPFEQLPEDWICPECGEAKGQFIEE